VQDHDQPVRLAEDAESARVVAALTHVQAGRVEKRNFGVRGLLRLKHRRELAHARIGQLGRADLALLDARGVRSDPRQPLEDGALTGARETDEANLHWVSK